LNNKLRATRKYLGGSVKHTAGQLKIENLSLSYLIDEVDAMAEVRPLYEQEIEPKSQSNEQIANLLGVEEIEWNQRSKSHFILEGDSNIRYFHRVAKGVHRKKLIHCLVHDEVTIERHEELKSYITNLLRIVLGDP
jgi:hypothetical protein